MRRARVILSANKEVHVYLILSGMMGGNQSSTKRSVARDSEKGKEPAVEPANFIGYMQLIPDDQLTADLTFIRSVQGKMCTIFPHGGRAQLEGRLRAIRFGKNTEFIAAEQADIIKRRMEKHVAAMAVVAGDYQSAYTACCIYLGREPVAKQITSEDDLVAICDALMAESNDWFFEGRPGYEFTDDNGIVYRPYTFQFAKKIHSGESSVDEDVRVSILRMIAMFIVETYESRARAAVA